MPPWICLTQRRLSVVRYRDLHILCELQGTSRGARRLLWPEYITVDRQNIAFENIVDGPHSLEGRAALLIASAEIMSEIEDAVAQSLLSAFSQGAFSSDTAKEIIAASQQK